MKHAKVFDYQLQVESLYGILGPDKKWTGMIGAMLRNETDIVGPFFMDERRGSVVQFVSPLDFSQLVLVTGLTHASNYPFLIFKVFSIELWLAFLMAVFIVAGATSLIYFILPFPFKKTKMEACLRYLWLFLMSLIGKDFGAKGSWYLKYILNSRSFRFIQGVWLLSVLIFVNTYQGSIISSFAANKLKPKYETLEEVINDNNVAVGTYPNSFPYLCLSKLANTTLEPIWLRAQENLVYEVSHTPEWMDRVEKGKMVIVAELGHTKYLIGKRFERTGLCGIRVVPLRLCASYLALGARKDLSRSFINKFNYEILRFNEGGLSKRHKTKSVLFYDICTQGRTSTTHPLSLADLTGAFTILIVGLSTASVCAVIELLMNNRIQKRQTE
ncbi:Glutamate receptor 1 like protein [Argiope bruennichi]|uniref:Glutamate receptor 1 like protein n=1 Tax=Argiope bruennichi TaxID=94029 RepID=A0A8T0G3W0_ARGBR|nr:Glutamate receptor 1 like protein [Argiope bruennichi]